MIALTVALAVFVGVALGMLGGGGSILTVPLLAYVAGIDAKQAIALIFGAAGMAGAYLGGVLARFIRPIPIVTIFVEGLVVAWSPAWPCHRSSWPKRFISPWGSSPRH